MIKEDDSWKITAVTSSIHAEIVIPRLSNIVHIDGKWTTSDEWSDALEVPMEYNGYDPCPNNGTTYIRIKHDGSYLYVLVDYISDSTPRSPPRGNWWEGVEVYFDPEQNGGWTPQPDDYLYNFCVEPAQQWKAKVKTTDGKWDWAHQYTSEEIQKLMAFSSDATNDPYTTNKHVIYELKIPLPDKKEFGLFIDATDHGAKSFMTWPGKVWNEIPQAWGILKLSQ